ncbi:MAG: hypothetical protein LBB73_01690 [Dysgonamonadaceae bacterium]|nr:hypothetical protein [Dysgonamonadaceae bacterium]
MHRGVRTNQAQGKYCLQDRPGLLYLSSVLPSELHENIPPLPAGSLSRLTCPATARPKYRTRRVDLQTGERIINLRRQCNNRCEIRDILRENAASVSGPGGSDRRQKGSYRDVCHPEGVIFSNGSTVWKLRP